MAAETSSSSSRSSSSPADSYIGSLISLTSKSEIRYEGILYNINTEESSIGLRNVRSFGTEGRKKDGPQVPPSEKIYEYILFRGTDIKDLQVKSSPPVQTTVTTESINSDPAIIQSHYSRPSSMSTSLSSAAAGGPLSNLNSHTTQIGQPSESESSEITIQSHYSHAPSTSTSFPGPASGHLPTLNSHAAHLGQHGPPFQGSLPLYQPGGNLGSWGPSPSPSANGSGLSMPMYWQGYYGLPSGVSSLHQQSVLQIPPGLQMPPSLQPQMQYPGFNASLPAGSSNVQGSNPPEYPSSLVSSATASFNLPTLPVSTMSSSLPLAPPLTLASDALPILAPNKALSAPPAAPLSTNLPSLPNLTSPVTNVNAIVPPNSNKPSPTPAPTMSRQSISLPISSAVVATSIPIQKETSIPSLITPGQLLQSGSASASLSQNTHLDHKDVEVVRVSPTSLSDKTALVPKESQPPILPLPPTRAIQKLNGAPFRSHYNYRGRDRSGTGSSRPVTSFTEDFDFTAMNEKFNKDEVWGHLGKSTKSHLKGKDEDGEGSDEGDLQYEDEDAMPKLEAKGVYNKDDFFDSLSCNALDNDSRGGRRFSEQVKLDTETFGDHARNRGGRGPSYGGRSRGYHYNGGRGYGYSGRGGGGYGYSGRGGGYGYGGRGRGRGAWGVPRDF